MNRQVLKQIKSVVLGDLVRAEWFDASVGKSLSSGGAIDVPVKSWGVYLGVLGEKNKHIILAQNTFRYTEQIFDIDFTAIPLSWATTITVVNTSEVSNDEAKTLLNSFLSGRCRTLKRRVVNHERLH
jgi:hypothetical protein